MRVQKMVDRIIRKIDLCILLWVDCRVEARGRDRGVGLRSS